MSTTGYFKCDLCGARSDHGHPMVNNTHNFVVDVAIALNPEDTEPLGKIAVGRLKHRDERGLINDPAALEHLCHKCFRQVLLALVRGINLFLEELPNRKEHKQS